MDSKDASDVRTKIISFVQSQGPSIPVRIAKDVGLSILFTSAFLSELFSDKMLKMSNMRVGSSPIYFIEGQEPMLERFAENLKSKEKEAFLLLKENGFLYDSHQLPAIRVALREIKDFAVPFRHNEQIIWRFFTVPESEFVPIPVKEHKKEEIVVISEPKKEEIQEKEVVKEEKYEERYHEKSKPVVKQKTHKKPLKKKPQKNDDKFLLRVKEFLAKSDFEIISIEGLKKDELVLKIKKDNEESVLVAYNKKKIDEKDIIKAAHIASEIGLKYSILSLSELPKKVSDLISALGNIKDIRKVE